MAVKVSGVASTIEGLTEFRQHLKGLDAAWARQQSRLMKSIAQEAAHDARAVAEAKGGVYAKSAAAIVPLGPYTTSARLAVVPGAGTEMAQATFWGTLRRTGWYAKHRYTPGGAATHALRHGIGAALPARKRAKGYGLQHPMWVGNTWDTAVAGQGPYALNDALATNVARYLERLEAGLEDLAVKSGFERK